MHFSQGANATGSQLSKSLPGARGWTHPFLLLLANPFALALSNCSMLLGTLAGPEAGLPSGSLRVLRSFPNLQTRDLFVHLKVGDSGFVTMVVKNLVSGRRQLCL